ncbi:MAG: IS110 family transposase [Bacteroidota bacterium]
MNKVYGIDISKKSFEVFELSSSGNSRSYSHLNTSSGINSWLKELSSIEPDPQGYQEESIFVMEASGNYYLQLACLLNESGHHVKVVNPLVIRRYSQMLLKRTKTDREDAKLIAFYGQQHRTEIPQWKPTEKELGKLRQLFTVIENLQKQLTMTRNLVESMSRNPFKDTGLMAEIKRQIQITSKRIIRLEKQLEQVVKTHFKDTYDALMSIPGVGIKTASSMIAITHNFTKFDSAKQLASYVGLCPRIFESGSSVKAKARIVKMGQALPRKYLFMGAFSALKYNEPCVKLAKRLQDKGKHFTLIRTAVAHKLLRIIFAVGKSKQKFDPNFT